MVAVVEQVFRILGRLRHNGIPVKNPRGRINPEATLDENSFEELQPSLQPSASESSSNITKRACSCIGAILTHIPVVDTISQAECIPIVTNIQDIVVNDERLNIIALACTNVTQAPSSATCASAARGRLTMLAISKKIVYIFVVQANAVQQCLGPVLGTDMWSVINPQL